MALIRNTTYRLEWEDWQGAACELDIVDLETYKADVVQLTPGATPFKTDRDDDESPLAPVRSGKGTISMIGNYKTLPLEVTSGYRYRVRLTRGGALAWCGWLTGDTISQNYETAPDEFALECTDDLGALELWRMTQQDYSKDGNTYPGGMSPARISDVQGMSPARISDVLAEIFSHINGAYTEPTIGVADTLSFVFPVENGTDMWQLKDYVRRLAFFTDKDLDDDEDDEADTDGTFMESDTCLAALEKICTAMGWTCNAQGLKIVFSSPRSTGANVEMTFAELYAGTVPETTTAIGALAPVPMGAHETDRYPGVHKTRVKAEVSGAEDLLPDIEDMCEFAEDNGTQTWQTSYKVTTKTLRAVSYTAKSRRFTLQGYEMNLKSTVEKPSSVDDYDITPVETAPSDWTEIKGTQLESHGDIVPGFAKFDAYLPDDDKKNYEFTTGLMVTCRYACTPNLTYKYINYTPKVPVASLRGYSVALLSGYLVFNAKITNFRFVPNYSDWTIKGLPVSIRVGTKYWNHTNQTWGTAATVCYLPLDKAAGAQVNDTKTLEQDCSGASGYIIPITEELNGDVEVKVYTAASYGYSKTSLGDFTYLPFLYYAVSGISLRFRNKDAVDHKDLPDHYNYTQYTDGWKDDSEEVSVSLHSTRDGQAARGQMLTKSGDNYLPLEKVNGKRPEEWLLEKLASFYTRARRMVKITAQYSAAATPGDVYTDGDGGKWSLLGVTETNWLTGQCTLYLVDLPAATEN